MTKLTPEEMQNLLTFRDQRRRRRKVGSIWDADQRLRWHEKQIERILAALLLILFLTCASIAVAITAHLCAQAGGQYKPFRCSMPPTGGFGSFTA